MVKKKEDMIEEPKVVEVIKEVEVIVEVIKEVFVPIEPIDADRERLEKVVKNAVIYAGQTSRFSEKVTTILETIEADFRIVAKPEPEKEEEVTE